MEERIESIGENEKINICVIKLQAEIRYYLQSIALNRKTKNMECIKILQKNIRHWQKNYEDAWYQMYGHIRPRLKRTKMREMIEKMQKQMVLLEEKMMKENDEYDSFQQKISEIESEKQKLMDQLEMVKSGATTVEERLSAAKNANNELQKMLNDANNLLTKQENETSEAQTLKQNAQLNYDNARSNLGSLNELLEQSENERKSKEEQINSLRDELNHQDEVIAKLNKEKRRQEDQCRQMDQDLQTQESRILQSNREKSKLERAIDEVEDRIEREHRNRLQKEKYKRKSEGELKLIEEQLEELNKAKGELERKIQQAEIIIRDLGVKIEEQEAFTSHIYKQTKISNIRIQDLEEEIESEYQTRQKSDRLQCDLQREITEVSEHLQDHMGMMDAQIQMNKKKELEIIRLRQELEEFNISQENMLANFRMENMQKVTVQNSDLERLRVEKTNIDKECEEMSSEKERINEILDGERKRKLEQERLLKMTHIQITELKKKWDDQMKKIQELTFQKSRIANENARLQQQIDDLQMQITNMQLSKAQHDNHLQDLRKRLEEGAKERSSLDLIAKSLNYDIKQLNDSIESEESEKVELRRILSKKNAEVQQWHERVEGAELIEVSELDELKQKQQMQIIQLHESLDATNSKITAIEKLKNHLTNDIEATRVECQLHMATATNLERKQAESNREIQIFKQNVNNIRCEVNAILRDKRNVSSNLFKLQSTNEGFEEQVELSKRENKTLIQELKILKDQYDNGARTFHEMQKLIHKLKIEKEELQQALTESEDSLHMEATKVTKLQNDKEQCKLDLEKQFQSREEEFNLIQRNHEHATESLQTSLDIERKSKAELLNQKKQHEMNINELEIELDQASRVNVDMQKSIKRYIELIKNLQKQLEEEQQTRQGFSSNQISTEKRIAVINSENEEITTSIMKLERAVNQHNNDWKECCEKIKELASKNSTLTSVKRKLEGEIQIARDDVQEVLKQLKAMDECNSKASADSVRLTEEVSQEREHAQHIERLSKGLELTLKATKAKLEDTEMAARKGIQRMIAEEEKRIKILQQEVDKECSQAQDATRLFHKNSRRSREIKLQLDEDQKAFTRLDELMNKLQKSLKAQKIHLDENSNLVLSNQQKYRELLMQLENAEERAAVAENSLLRMRTKSRIGNTLMNSQNEVLNSDQVVEKQ